MENAMKKLMLLTCIIPVIAIAAFADDVPDYIALRKQVKQLRVELARQGAYAFVTNRETTPPVAPHIHSQFWVDWLPKTNVEQIAYEQEKRDFGLDFVGQIAKLALVEIPLEDVEAHETSARRMLAIAEWLKTSGGYGNQFLKKWSENTVLSFLGGMAVNAQCDTNRVLKLMSRIDGVQDDVNRQVAILNEESPHRYSIPRCTTIYDASEKLEQQWIPRQAAGIRYFRGMRKNGNLIFNYPQVKDDGPREYAFYLPDGYRGGRHTPDAFWHLKQHSAVCIYGLRTKMADEIFQILHGRSALGDLPVPSDAEIKDSNLGFFGYCSHLNDAMRKATKGREQRFMGSHAVLRIYRHEFVDAFTRSLQLEREKDARILDSQKSSTDGAKR
jgi:hypothetical protein